MLVAGPLPFIAVAYVLTACMVYNYEHTMQKSLMTFTIL